MGDDLVRPNARIVSPALSVRSLIDAGQRGRPVYVPRQPPARVRTGSTERVCTHSQTALLARADPLFYTWVEGTAT
jgi:hypothetical protein